MSKRLISVILGLAVLLSSLVVSVGASESGSTQQSLNVLEFDTVNGSGDFYMRGGSGKATAKFTLPYGTLVRYIDMYISTNNKVFDSINWVVNGTSYPLTVESVYGNTYYRVYGQISGGYTDLIQLDFKWSDSGNNYLQFYRVTVSSQAYSVYQSPSALKLEALDVQSSTQDRGDSTVILTDYCGAYGAYMADTAGSYLATITNSQWQKYDYFNFAAVVHASTLNSVIVTIGNQSVPFEINFIDSSIPSYDTTINSEWHSENDVYYDVNIRVDLTGFNRVVADDLVVSLAGTSGRVTVALYDSRGYTIAALPDAETTWLQKIWKSLEGGFKSVVNAINGNSSAADEFQDDVSEKTEEIEHMAGVMDSIDTPDSFNPAVPEVQNVSMLVSGGGLGDVIMNPYVFPLFALSMTFCFVSYALFGKKG